MRFGLYLKKNGIISAEQLVAALEAQLATLPPIGQLALEEGIVSPRDVFNVLQEQRRSADMRFGELAIEMGLMTRDELMRLLMIQADRKRPLADVFVTEGMASEQQIGQEMAKFRLLQADRSAAKAGAFKVVPAPRRHASMMLAGAASLVN